MNPMKKIYSIFAVLALMSTSCSWLDITPADTVVEEELFSEAEGFHNAINGLYNSMSDSELYGRELSYGFVEVFVPKLCGRSKIRRIYQRLVILLGLLSAVEV